MNRVYHYPDRGYSLDEKLIFCRMKNTLYRPVFHPKMFGRIQYLVFSSLYHVHPCYHLILVSGGRCYFHLSPQQRFLLEEGTLLLINPNVPHCFSQVGSIPVEHTGLLWKMVDDQELPGVWPLQLLVDRTRSEPILFALLNRLEIGELLVQYRELQRILEKNLKKQPFSSAAFALIMRMLRSLLPGKGGDPGDRKPQTALLRQIELLADDHLADPDFNLKEIAWRFKRTPHYLSRQFQELYGYTIPDYLTRLRIRRARLLLLSTRLPITEIARQCGYASPGYLSKIFSRQCGVTPLAFRRSSSCRPGPPIHQPVVKVEKTYWDDLPLVED